MSRTLVIQLARLGDLIQTLPAITALGQQQRFASPDLLCAAPLAPIARWFPGVHRVIEWDGALWRRCAKQWGSGERPWDEARRAMRELIETPYDVVFNLNQHPRAIYAAHLAGREVVGAGEGGPLSSDLPSWGRYLRSVAHSRRGNRVHLADAFCGLCRVAPSAMVPRLTISQRPLPLDLDAVGCSTGVWVAVIVGAGAPDRCMPIAVWIDWITSFLDVCPAGRVVLVGSGTERERAAAIQDGLPPMCLSKIWDACGRTDLQQLAILLARCTWAVGADTGPLHLAASLGTRVMGWYVARARVHETGPYGHGHWIWQAERSPPQTWPVKESLTLLASAEAAVPPPDVDGWSLWTSRFDRWGTFYVRLGAEDNAPERERVWKACSIGSSSGTERSMAQTY
jgi:ADP-heptose:LPS heptosyltransferase